MRSRRQIGEAPCRCAIRPVSARGRQKFALTSKQQRLIVGTAGAKKNIGEEFVFRALAIIATLLIVCSQSASAQDGQKWVAAWAASSQGPYPSGNPSAQPDQRFALP